jgi:hypothetical protein
MADTYGVTATNIAAEIPALFPTGFSAASKPAQSLVESWISTADVKVQLAILIDVGTPPTVSDKAALLAKRFITNYALANVMRVVYAGRQPQDVQAAAKPYADEATALYGDLCALGKNAVGDGTADESHVRGNMGNGAFPDRELLISDHQLDGDRNPRRGHW